MELIDSILRWLLPRGCVQCKEAPLQHMDICLACKNALPFIKHACRTCGMPIEAKDALICGACVKEALPFDRLYALFKYEQPVSHWIHQFKFKQNFVMGMLFSKLLIESIQEKWYVDMPLPELLIPVPLHNSRIRYRGFNQAIELARPICKALPSIKRGKEICKRVFKTETQSTLAANKRRKNMRNAFQVMAPLDGRHIVILDDVVTTSQTVSSLATACKKAGAKKIDVWCIAKTCPTVG